MRSCIDFIPRPTNAPFSASARPPARSQAFGSYGDRSLLNGTTPRGGSNLNLVGGTPLMGTSRRAGAQLQNDGAFSSAGGSAASKPAFSFLMENCNDPASPLNAPVRCHTRARAHPHKHLHRALSASSDYNHSMQPPYRVCRSRRRCSPSFGTPGRAPARRSATPLAFPPGARPPPFGW